MLWLMAGLLALAGLAGLVVAPRVMRSPALHAVGLAVAAGTLLTLILGHLLPEAMTADVHAGTLAAVGFVAMMLVHRLVLRVDPCCEHQHTAGTALPSFVALALCSFNDGLIAAGEVAHFWHSPLILGLLLHKATAAFALVLLLRELAGDQRAGLRFAYLAIFVLMTPLAFLLSASIGSYLGWLPYAIALGGGALLHVVVGSLIPKVEEIAEHGRGKLVLGAFVAAILVNGAFNVVHLSSHEHAPGAGHVHGR